MHSICFPTDTGETKTMRKFSSLEILETFTKGNLSVGICASRLQSCDDTHGDIVAAFDEIIDLVNSDGGWSFYGWVKRGLINDVSILGNGIKEPRDNEILSQEISTNVVHIKPSKKYYLDLSTICGRFLGNLKFEFSTL